MTKPSTNHGPVRRLVRYMRRAALAFLVLSVGSISVIHAQVLVTDVTAISTTEEGFKSQLAQSIERYTRQGQMFAKQIEQYQQQILQYQEVLTSVQQYATGGISLSSEKLTPISDATSLIQQTCPGAGGVGVLGSMISIISSPLNNSITKDQQIICAQIVLAKVEKYNKTVEIVNKTQDFGQELNGLIAGVSTLTTQGDSDRMTAQISAHGEQLAWERQEWLTQMKRYDAIIEALQQQQGLLAKVALDGTKVTLGSLVQAAAFAKAFE